MGNFNKVLSFILGLVVVIVFVIVLSKRLNLQNKFIPFGNKPTPTITEKVDNNDEPVIKFSEPTEVLDLVETTKEDSIRNVQSIPETGPSALLLYFYASAGAVGFFLSRFKK